LRNGDAANATPNSNNLAVPSSGSKRD
jgi:hypothetical protein